MALPPEVVKGYLVLTVEEASGKTQRDQFSWDNTGPFEAFVKVEIRGGARNVKAQTRKAPLVGESITWREELRLELLEGASELRFMLCREKFQGNKRGTSVIAACGIYVNDILEAVPIDKYFELFKPNAGGEGGFVRISMDFVKDLAALDRKDLTASPLQPTVAFGQATTASNVTGLLQGVVSADTVAEVAKRVATIGNEPDVPPSAPKRRGKKLAVLLPTLLLAGAATVAGVLLKRRN